MDQYLSEYHLTDILESWFPLTSFGLTILRISTQKHKSRLDYYTVIFISMLHQQPWEPYTLLSFIHIWNTQSLCGIHISARILTLESVQRFATKICTKSWNTNYQYCLGKLRLQTLNMRSSCLKQCHLYKLVHGLSIFPNSPVTTSSSHSYPTCSNHNLSLHVPSSRTNAYYYSFFCDAIRTWNSLPCSVASLPSLNLFKKTVSNYL